MDYLSILRVALRDLIGYLVPGAVCLVALQGLLKLAIFATPLGFLEIEPEWASLGVLILVAYVYGRVGNLLAGILFDKRPLDAHRGIIAWVLRKSAILSEYSWETIQDRRIDRSVLDAARRYLRHEQWQRALQLEGEEPTDEDLKVLLRKQIFRLIFYQAPDLYWWYIDRPNVLRHGVQSLFGGFLLNVLTLSALGTCRSLAQGLGSSRELVPLLAAQVAGAILAGITVCRARAYQVRSEGDTALLWLRSGPELARWRPPKFGEESPNPSAGEDG